MSSHRPGITRTTLNAITATNLVLQTGGEGFTDITQHLKEFLVESRAIHGVLLAFLRHTSASLVIQENADPNVQTDLLTALRRLAPLRAAGFMRAKGPTTCPRISVRC